MLLIIPQVTLAFKSSFTAWSSCIQSLLSICYPHKEPLSSYINIIRLIVANFMFYLNDISWAKAQLFFSRFLSIYD